MADRLRTIGFDGVPYDAATGRSRHPADRPYPRPSQGYEALTRPLEALEAGKWLTLSDPTPCTIGSGEVPCDELCAVLKASAPRPYPRPSFHPEALTSVLTALSSNGARARRTHV